MNKKLSRNDVYAIISSVEEDYPNITEASEDIYNLYSKRIENSFYSNYDETQQESLITAIVDQYKASGNIGRVELFLEQKETGIKGIEKYYNFVGEKEVEKIQRAIIDNGLSRDVLKGIKVTDKLINDITIKDTNERVVAEFSTYNGSPVLVYMDIYDGSGNLVYSYGKSKMIDDIPEGAEYDEEMPVHYTLSAKEKLAWSGAEEKITLYGREIIKRTNKKGITQYAYKDTGKLVSREDRLTIMEY